MKKNHFMLMVVSLILSSFALGFSVATVVANKYIIRPLNEDLVEARAANDFKWEILQHYDSIYTLILDMSITYNWADTMGSDTYCDLLNQMNAVDSLYNTQQ